jgi:ribosomal protein S8E
VICADGFWQWQGANCPICAAPDTLIATPEGERRISSLRPGDLVYSVHQGGVVAVPLRHVASTPVEQHWVIRATLASSAVLEVSPGHPTTDGRTFGELVAGDQLDPQNAVVAVELVPYEHERTYDILPASSTGTYFAAGALIRSTLAEPLRLSGAPQRSGSALGCGT